MRASSPFFSIVLPTFNRARLIKRAIESAIAQTFSDWELIIIDDGSSDNTFEIIKQVILSDKRMRYHFAQNQGLAGARSTGLSIAQGSFITFLDSDDEYLPQHLALRAEYLKAHPSVQLLHGGVEIIGERTVPDKYDPSHRIHLNECVIGGTFVISNKLLDTLSWNREIKYGDDNDFFERASQAGALIDKVDFPTYRYYRTESDSLCAIVEREGIEGIEVYRKS